MYQIDFVALEPVYGSIELDLDGVDTKEEATELAEKEVYRLYPLYERVTVTEVKEIA